ncbi:hypothetical protein ACIA5D_11230 [Actinoplanes sp. NPDC051513]|uniref:hypothetical protein n=1 Tax=Actinoplanes sp. NPDC051513 TaxID=3363908 RepID=UPI00379A819B
MTVDRATATAWIREVAADRWDAALAAQGFTRAATALTYTRKVADGGRQRLQLDLSVRPPAAPDSFQLTVRATTAFPTVAKLAIRLLGSTAGAFGKSDVVDTGLLDTLAPASPMLLFRAREELEALPVERYLLDPLVLYLDERKTVAALTEAKRAEWLATDQNPQYPSRFPVIVAAGELALGRRPEALATLQRAYPDGSPGRREYAEAFAELDSLAELGGPAEPHRPAELHGSAELRGPAELHGPAEPHGPAGPHGPAAKAAAAGGSPSPLTFALKTVTTLSLPPVPNPGPDQLERVVRGLNEERFFALLERSDGAYAQVGFGPKAGAAPGIYALEHRAAPEGEHLRAETGNQDEAVAFLQRFRAGDDGWRAHHEWRRLEL